MRSRQSARPGRGLICRSWWGVAIAQPYFNVLYGDQLVKTPPVHYVLSAYQTSTAVSVSYLFQVVSVLPETRTDTQIGLSAAALYEYGRKMGLYTVSFGRPGRSRPKS